MDRMIAILGFGFGLSLVTGSAWAQCPTDLGPSTPPQVLIACVASLAHEVADLKAKPAPTGVLPIGTIIASYLAPGQFALLVGESESDPLSKRTWILADGRSSSGTTFSRLTNDRPIPNLLGMFLRGIDENRLPGDVQPFATARPKSPFTGTTSSDGGFTPPPTAGFGGDRYNAGGHDYNAVGIHPTPPVPPHSHIFTITDGGDSETRPVNVGVYYYIKVN